MTAITHHISDPLMAAYVAGTLPHPYSMVIASHISMCDDCRARMAAHEMAGAAVMTDGAAVDVSAELKDGLFARLDEAAPREVSYKRSGVFPSPVMEALKGKPPKWKSLGFGVRQSILHDSAEGSVRLLYIPGGEAVPEHSHEGLELTLVLQGSFSDETGRFGVGDIEIADDDLEHTPHADPGEACICLAATTAPLRFRAWMPRLFQPMFRI